VTSSGCFVIAEVGVNHNGDVEEAKALVSAAKAAGADAVKFQTFRASSLVSESAPLAAYQRADESRQGEPTTQRAMLEGLELTQMEFALLKQECDRIGIEFMTSAFGVTDLLQVLDLAPRRLKVPSGELTDVPYLRQVARAGLPVILSTGMASQREVQWAVQILEHGGLLREKLTVLQCTSSYPTLISEVNLLAMRSIRDSLDVAVGFSDHTTSETLGAAAVALGARVIEKHLTRDRDAVGPDHKASLDADQFARYLTAIRESELALGDGVKTPQNSEQEMRLLARKSIVAARLICRGMTIRDEDLTLKRPATGVSGEKWDEVVGSVAQRDYEPDEMIQL
jgi:N,N'-diacetyllegionaminate synthase